MEQKLFLSDERIQLIRQKYQAGQGRPEDGDDGHFAIRAQGVEMGCEVAREIYEPELSRLRGLLDEAEKAGDEMRDAINYHMEEHVGENRIPYGTELDMRTAAARWNDMRSKLRK